MTINPTGARIVQDIIGLGEELQQLLEEIEQLNEIISWCELKDSAPSIVALRYSKLTGIKVNLRI